MLAASQSKNSPDKFFLSKKKCSQSALSITSDYYSNHSESYTQFTPLVKKLHVSSNLSTSNDYILDSLKDDIESQLTSMVRKEVSMNLSKLVLT